MARAFFLFIAFVAAVAGAEPAKKVFELSADEKSSRTLKVNRGERVELRWKSDRRMTLHLHGYDLERTIGPQAPAVMAFKADIAGRFPVSEHGHGGRHGRTVLYLEVHP
jgi:hypothetical protein